MRLPSWLRWRPQLPRNFNDQLLLLIGLLYVQLFLFLAIAHWAPIGAPVLSAPAAEWYALHNQVGGEAGETPGPRLSALDRLRWHLQSATDRMDSWVQTNSATHPARAPKLPSSGSAPLLHAQGPRDQLQFHTHSRSPYMFRYLDHGARRYRSRLALQKHMLEDTVRQRVWQGAQATPAQLTAEEPPTGGGDLSPSLAPLTAAQHADAALAAVLSAWEKSNIDSACTREVGSGMLSRWEATAVSYCDKEGAATAGSGTDLSDDTIRRTVNKYRAGDSSDAAQSEPLPAGTLSCRSTTLEFMPPPTAPHSFCSAHNLFIDLSTFRSNADAPKFRAGYVMGKGNHYHYQKVATSVATAAATNAGSLQSMPSSSFSGACDPTKGYDISRISADHQRDIIDGFGVAGAKQRRVWGDYLAAVASGKATLPSPAARGVAKEKVEDSLKPYLAPVLSSGHPPLLVLPWTLLLITRENGEHCNFYHTMTDLFNAFLMVRHFGLQRSQIQVLMLDNHGPSPFDPAWETVFSGAGPMLKANTLMADGFGMGNILASSAVMVPPGYSSPLYRHLFEDDSACSKMADVFPEFARFFLSAYELTYRRWTRGATLQDMAGLDPAQETRAVRQTIVGSAAGPLTSNEVIPPDSVALHVVFISRRPYDLFVDKTQMSRQILNEDTLLSFMLPQSPTASRFSDVRIDVVDLARMDFKQQVALMSSADVLVGMHGAALSHVMFLPPWAALLELHPIDQKWQCFKHQAEWSGHSYFSWRNARQEAQREVQTGNGVDVDPVAFASLLEQALERVRDQRRRLDRDVANELKKRK